MLDDVGFPWDVLMNFGHDLFFSMSLRFFDRSNDRIGEDADPHASQDRFDLWLATVPEKEEVIDDEEEEAVGQKD